MAQEEPTLHTCNTVIKDSPLRPPLRHAGDPTGQQGAASSPAPPVHHSSMFVSKPYSIAYYKPQDSCFQSAPASAVKQ